MYYNLNKMTLYNHINNSKSINKDFISSIKR